MPTRRLGPGSVAARALLVLALLMSGCSEVVPGVSRPPAGGPRALIDWVPFLKLDGITYMSQPSGSGRPLEEADLGGEVARVRFKVADNVDDPSYRIRNGDAAFLEPGTPVFGLEAYDRRFRLAARSNGELLPFETDSNPGASTGADLLDLAVDVRRIRVNSATDGLTLVGGISDRAQVDRLVAVVLAAPVNQNPPPSAEESRRWFIAFESRTGRRRRERSRWTRGSSPG